MSTPASRSQQREGASNAGTGRRRLPLRMHLLGLVLAAILPLVLFAAAVIATHARDERAALELRMTDKAAQVAAAVDAELRRSIAMLEVVGSTGSLQRGDLQAFHEFARRLVQAQPGWSNVQLMGPAGEHLVNPRLPYGTPLPPLRRPDLVVTAARSRQPLVSELVPAAVARGELTAVYVPVLQDGTTQYVVAAGIEPHNWQKVIESRMPPDLEAVLLDRNSLVIASTAAQLRGRGDGVVKAGLLPSGRRVALAPDGDDGRVQRAVVDGVEVYVATSRAPLSGWTVATMTPTQRVERPLRQSALGLAGGFAALLALGLLLATALAQRLARSILSLVDGVAAVAAGRPPPPQEDGVHEVHHARAALIRTAEGVAAQLQREEALRKRLEAHEAARNSFLGVLGHELRNPLAPLRNIAAILKRAQGGGEPVRKAATVLDRQTAHLARLVDDLLDVTRIQNGKIELRKEALDLAQLARHVVADQEGAIRAADIEVLLDVPEAPVMVHGDPARLTQVIGNLLNNACKFTPSLGTISVRVEAAQGRARVSVADTGAGIDPDTLRNIFEPFVQGPQDEARVRGGLGLGLALVDALVRQHGGTVSAASEGPGKGSTFTVDLPLLPGVAAAAEVRQEALQGGAQPASGAPVANEAPVAAPAATAAPLAQAAAAPRKRRVLIVDDDGDGTQTTAALVEALGHTPRIAGDVESALQACREEVPDVVLCDIALPGADGYSLARQLRADPCFANTKLVVVSGYAMPEHHQASAQAGFDLHLAKPVSLERLQQVLAED